MPSRSAAWVSRPLSGPTKRRPEPVRRATGRRALPTPGSTTARCTPTGRYGTARASTTAPCSTACGAIPWVTSITGASGAIRRITPRQTPTNSSWSPKSVRKVITRTLTPGRAPPPPRRARRGRACAPRRRPRARRSARPGSSPGRSTPPAACPRSPRTPARPTPTRAPPRPPPAAPVAGGRCGRAARSRRRARRSAAAARSPPRGRGSCPPAAGTRRAGRRRRRPSGRSPARSRARNLPKVPALGPGPAEHLRTHGIEPDFVPTVSSVDGLLAEFPRPEGRILYLAAENARRRPIDALGADYVPLYRTVLLRPEPPAGDVVVLASGSAARAFAASGGRQPVVSIGPETTRVARSVGLEVAAEARTHDLDGLVAAVEELARA